MAAFQEAKERVPDSGLPGLVLSGCVAGAVAWMVPYPFDTLRNRLSGGHHTSILSCVRDMYAQGGLGGFYRGVGYTLVRAVPVAAVTLPTYDLVLRQLRGGSE